MEHPRIYAGVDTHSDTHTLALIDEHGRPLATQTFTADPTGYERLVAMIGDPGDCLGVGVEAPTRTGRRSPDGSSRPGTTYTRCSGPNARCDAGTASPIPSTHSPRPAACSRATGPACRRARMGGSRRYAP